MSTENKKRKGLKVFLLKLISCVLILFLLICMILTIGVSDRLLSPVNNGVHSSPEEIGYDDYLDVSIPSSNGDILRGWYIPASNNSKNFSDKVIIVSHNYESSREMNEISGLFLYRYLLKAGYDVVTFDYSGSGLSDGDFYTFGCEEKDELLTVIQEVNVMNPEARIGLFGWAFGAASAICAGCESDLVSVVISDSSYADLDQYLDSELYIWTKLPAFLFNFPVKMVMSIKSRCRFSECSPIDSLNRTEGKSFFFIQCENDTVIPSGTADSLAKAAEKKNFSDSWIISGSSHIMGFMDQEENYVNRILNFLQNHF